MKIGRNDLCLCGSELKYKKCCMKKNSATKTEKRAFSVNEILSLLEVALKNISSVNRDVPNISVKQIRLLHGKTLECQFYARFENSLDIKTEISSIMGALHGFFKDGSFENLKLNYYAVRAYDKSDNEIVYALSSIEAAGMIGNGNAIDWMKSTIFQENTKDYRIGIAKRQISEIENALRKIVVDRLSLKHGSGWFKLSLGNRLFESIKGTYLNQFGDETEDGKILIEYTYILQLKKIICTNWKDFSDLFDSKNKFEKFMVELNGFRREEAHNRDVSTDHLKNLNIIYEFVLINICKVYREILPSYLIDDWKDNLNKIMFPKPDLPYSDSDIDTEPDSKLKYDKAISNLQYLVDHIADKELKLRSIVVPIQKKKIHQELIDTLNNYRLLHEELIESGKTGDYSLVHAKQQELDLFRIKIREFTEKYIYEES